MVDEDGEEREMRSQIAPGVVACIKEKVSVHDGMKQAVQKKRRSKVSCEAGIVRKSKMK